MWPIWGLPQIFPNDDWRLQEQHLNSSTVQSHWWTQAVLEDEKQQETCRIFHIAKKWEPKTPPLCYQVHMLLINLYLKANKAILLMCTSIQFSCNCLIYIAPINNTSFKGSLQSILYFHNSKNNTKHSVTSYQETLPSMKERAEKTKHVSIQMCLLARQIMIYCKIKL